MNIQLLQGEFNSKDAMDLITQMIHIKIKYHEHKIDNNSPEEEIKFRESKIKRLQKELFEFKNKYGQKNTKVNIDAMIKIDN
jgi:hypothetical protein